jgi:hypothetical protein
LHCFTHTDDGKRNAPEPYKVFPLHLYVIHFFYKLCRVSQAQTNPLLLPPNSLNANSSRSATRIRYLSLQLNLYQYRSMAFRRTSFTSICSHISRITSNMSAYPLTCLP